MIENLRRKGRGQVLAGVVMLLVVLLILVPAMVQWVQIDSVASRVLAADRRSERLTFVLA